jgi:SP family galactose:H+ symporter-like MFS transporter
MQKGYALRVAIVAALAGLLFGLDLGVISGALPFIKADLALSISDEGWVVSSVLFSAAAGAIASAWLSQIWGRKYCILLSACLFALASIGSACATSITMLIMMRIVLGFAVGVATYNAPIYLAEVSPAQRRGGFITFYQFMITLGIVLAFLSDWLFTPTGNWQAMLGVIAIPAIVMFLLVFFLPRSPRWLMFKGHEAKAHTVLRKLLTPQEYTTSLDELKSSASHREPLRVLLRKKPFIAVVLLGVVLQMIQQFSGMNAILYYAPEMFSYAGYTSHSSQMFATLLIGIVNSIATLFAILFIDYFGRRLVLYVAGVMILISTVGLAILLIPGHVNATTGNLSLTVMFIFIIGYALGYGPVMWTLCAEIFPLNGRAFAMSCATMANWTASGVVGAITLPIINRLGIGYYFLLLSGLAILSLVFFRLFVPETKQVNLEHIEQNLWRGKPLRHLGAP